MAKNVALFLKPEPPQQPDLSRQIFVNRELEFEEARSQLHDFLKQPQHAVLAVVGLSRVGKSHFLKQFVQDVKQEFTACVDLRIVQRLPDAKFVLRNILAQLLDELASGWLRSGRTEPVPLQDFYLFRERMNPLIEGEADEINVSEMSTAVKSIQNQLTGGIKAGCKATVGLPSWMKLYLTAGLEGTAEATGQYQHQQGQAETQSTTRVIKYRAYTERQLCDLIGLAHALVRSAAGPDWRTLIIVDDFDLLTIGPDGALNPFPLLDGLHQLCQWDGLFVLSTVREDTYDNRTKTFQLLCNIPPLIEEEQLVEVYQRHVVQFNDGNDPFLRAFIDEAARTCDGKVGVFLEVLYRAWKDLPIRKRLRKLDLATHLDEVLEEIRKNLGDELYKKIVDAAAKAGGEIASPDASQLRVTSHRGMLMDDYSTLDRLRINPVFLAHLRRTFAAQS